MTRPKTVFALLALLAVIGLGTATVATGSMSTRFSAAFDCCNDPSCYPGCCPECPPDCCSEAQVVSALSFTCPVTREELAGSDCCSLKQESQSASVKSCCPPCPLCP
jgi:hypothetical protein